MLIHKAYKFRLYPNIEQQELIHKTFGCTRLVYNYYLNQKQELYQKERKNLSCYDCIKDLKNLLSGKEFLKEIDSMALRTSLFDLDDAYCRFFKGKKRYPKYKSKWKGNKFYQINTYYPSSQICNKCDYKNDGIKDLSIREYECPKCGSKLDRDYNAAINIMYEGLKRYMKELTA